MKSITLSIILGEIHHSANHIGWNISLSQSYWVKCIFQPIILLVIWHTLGVGWSHSSWLGKMAFSSLPFNHMTHLTELYQNCASLWGSAVPVHHSGARSLWQYRQHLTLTLCLGLNLIVSFQAYFLLQSTMICLSTCLRHAMAASTFRPKHITPSGCTLPRKSYGWDCQYISCWPWKATAQTTHTENEEEKNS